MASLSERLKAARREAQGLPPEETQAERDAEAARWQSTPEDVAGEPPLVQDDLLDEDFADDEVLSPLPDTDADVDPDSEDGHEEEQPRESLRTRAAAMGSLALDATGNFIVGQRDRTINAVRSYRERKALHREAIEHDYENTPERDLDALLTDDKEILGDHARDGFFRDRARKKADKLVDKIDHAEDTKDATTIREKYLEARSNFTQVKINKLQARIDNSPDNFFTRKLNGWRREKLRDLKAVNKKRTLRADNIEKRRQQKPEMTRKKIDELVKKKVDAMYNKAQRIELKRNGIRMHNRLKRAEFLAKLTPEDKKRIVREAIRQARKKSVRLGRLDMGYSPDNIPDEDNVDIRKVTDDYGRIIK